MQGLVVVDPGLEDTTVEELSELIKAKGKVLEPCIVEFPIRKVEDLCHLCYKAQSVRQVLLLLGSAPCKPNLEIIAKATSKIIKGVDWKWKRGVSFRCMAEHVMDTDFNSMDLEREVGGAIHDYLASLKLGPKVDLKDPDVTVFAVLGKNLYIGIDFAGRDLSKRAYKIYHHATALRGTIGYGLVRFSGFKPGETLVDPFCGSGIIPIEAAFFSSSFPINFHSKGFAFEKQGQGGGWDSLFKRWDKHKEPSALITGSDRLLMNVKASQNNAKIGGVDKFMKFSKGDVEWLDTQFSRQSVDHIVTHPPESSQRQNVNEIAKVYREFFYQADFVLKKGGKITALLTKPDFFIKMSAEKDFVVEKKYEVWSGKMHYVMVQLVRKKA